MSGPLLVCDVEAGGPPPVVAPCAPDGRPYAGAAVAVRVHGELVAHVEVAVDGVPDGASIAAAAQDAAREAIDAHLARDGGEATAGGAPRCRAALDRFLAGAPFASVVIATRDGERTLGACLRSLLASEYPAFEVVVVDNASREDGVRRVVEEHTGGPVAVRYVREDRPGVAQAHNTGVAHARGAVIAFTDDDVEVDALWLARLARGFTAAPNVGCVTGQILPAELLSEAQVWLEGSWGFGKGVERRIFDRTRPPGQRLHPYTAGIFGSGANMAFSAEALRAMGGFDPTLGTGSFALGGDDLAAFFDVIAAGFRLVYEPTAIIRHHHRPDYESLRRQAFAYGAGLTAYIVRTLAADPRRVLEVSLLAPWALSHALSPGSPKNARRPEDYPAELGKLERRGMVFGPYAYARSRWARRTAAAQVAA